MTRPRDSILTTLAFLIAAFLSNAAMADDSQPGFLELKETTANRYSVLWRAPNMAGRPSPLELQLPTTGRRSTRNECSRLGFPMPRAMGVRELFTADTRSGRPLRPLSRRNPHGCDLPGRDNPLITRAGVSKRDRETPALNRPEAGHGRRLRL